jgi:dTDP-4-dehydrorhamnose reductase
VSLKKILITGSNGQLGHSLNLFLKDKSFLTLNSSLSVGRYTNNGSDLSIEKNVSSLMTEFLPDFIINCAAYTNVDLCEKNKKQAYNANVVIVKNLLKNMPKESKLIHISTDYIFDGINGSYNEKSIPNPINYYGKTKLAAENLIRSSHKKYIIIRTGNLYSEYFDLTSNRLSWIISKLKNNTQIYAATDMISNPTTVNSISDIVFSLLPFNQDLIVNYSGQDKLSIYDFSKLVAKIFKFDQNLINSCTMEDLDFLAQRPIDVSLKTDLISDLINCNIYETEYSLKIISNIIR